MSETFNSNTINLVAGVVLPAVALGLTGVLGGATPDLIWLLALTVAVLGLLARPRGLSRRGGLAVIALYTLFVLWRVA